MGDGFLRYGIITGPHGMHGTLYCIPYSGDLSGLQTLKTFWIGEDPALAVPYQLESWRPFKKGALVELAGVRGREAAERLRRAVVWVDRDELPPLEEGEWYLEDLRGATVRDHEGRKIGTVIDFQEGGGGVLFVIHRGNRDILIPWVEAFVEKISEDGEILLTDRAPVDL